MAESLPYPDESFDLVVSTTSFDHWEDQGAGLAECARVLAPSGHFVLTDLFSMWLAPTMLLGHRDRARTKRRAGALLAAGLRLRDMAHPLLHDHRHGGGRQGRASRNAEGQGAMIGRPRRAGSGGGVRMKPVDAHGGDAQPVDPASPWAPFRHQTFAAVWSAQFVSNLGSWMQTVARSGSC